MKKLILGASCLLAVCGVRAENVVIDPASGETTNVQTRLTGDVSVTVNSGETDGGIVKLNPINSYTGGTTLGCGTLELARGDAASGLSDIGAGGLTLGVGTLRYAGLRDGVLSAAVTSAFTSLMTNRTCVLDVRNDLHVTGNWTQNYGTFIKTGPGTV